MPDSEVVTNIKEMVAYHRENILSIVEKIVNENNNYVLYGDNKEFYLSNSQYNISFEEDYIVAESRKNKGCKEYVSYLSISKIVEVPKPDLSYCRVEM